MTLQQKYKNGVQLRADVLVSDDGDSVTFHAKKSLTIKARSVTERHRLKSLKIGVASLIGLDSRSIKILSLLESVGYLKPFVGVDDGVLGRQLDWLSHFTNEPQALQTKLAQKKVLIVGCGGTGAIIAEHLVRAGLRHFILLDGAQVDLPDMNRQLPYVVADCGRDKTVALRDRLNQLSVETQVSVYTQYLTSSVELETLITLHRPDLVIGAADTPLGFIHHWIATACGNTSTAVLFGGVGLKEGTLGPLLTSTAACQKYAADTLAAAQKLKDADNIPKASICFTNSLVAVWLAFEAFKFLTNISPPLSANGAIAIDLFGVVGEMQWKHSV
jgi:tRNA A37 threonylcarbamoyladenosine dehydratase